MFSLIAHCDEDCQFHNSCLGSSKLRRFTNIWRFNVRLNHVLKSMTTYLLSRKFQSQKFLMDLSRYLSQSLFHFWICFCLHRACFDARALKIQNKSSQFVQNLNKSKIFCILCVKTFVKAFSMVWNLELENVRLRSN